MAFDRLRTHQQDMKSDKVLEWKITWSAVERNPHVCITSGNDLFLVLQFGEREISSKGE